MVDKVREIRGVILRKWRNRRVGIKFVSKKDRMLDLLYPCRTEPFSQAIRIFREQLFESEIAAVLIEDR